MADTDPTESPEPEQLRQTFPSILGGQTESTEDLPRPRSSELGAVESLVWFGGLIGLKYAVGYGVMLLPGIVQRLFPEATPTAESQSGAEILDRVWEQYSALLIAQTLIEACLVLLCIWLRLGRPKFVWQRPSISIGQLALILGGIAPVATLGAYGYQWMRALGIANGVSWYAFDPLSAMQVLLAYFSVPTSIALFAAAPAIVEEFIFRRLIGQGLVARLGTTTGVLMTSTMFGLSHWHLPHVVSAFVMGLFLHLTYLKTRSLTAPILVHFVNNLMWILLSRSTLDPDGWNFGSERQEYSDWSSLLMAGLACLASVVTAIALAATRSPASMDSSTTPTQQPVVDSSSTQTWPALLNLVSMLGNGGFWWLWIEELARPPRFQ